MFNTKTFILVLCALVAVALSAATDFGFTVASVEFNYVGTDSVKVTLSATTGLTTGVVQANATGCDHTTGGTAPSSDVFTTNVTPENTMQICISDGTDHQVLALGVNPQPTAFASKVVLNDTLTAVYNNATVGLTVKLEAVADNTSCTFGTADITPVSDDFTLTVNTYGTTNNEVCGMLTDGTTTTKFSETIAGFDFATGNFSNAAISKDATTTTLTFDHSTLDFTIGYTAGIIADAATCADAEADTAITGTAPNFTLAETAVMADGDYKICIKQTATGALVTYGPATLTATTTDFGLTINAVEFDKVNSTVKVTFADATAITKGAVQASGTSCTAALADAGDAKVGNVVTTSIAPADGMHICVRSDAFYQDVSLAVNPQPTAFASKVVLNDTLTAVYNNATVGLTVKLEAVADNTSCTFGTADITPVSDDFTLTVNTYGTTNNEVCGMLTDGTTTTKFSETIAGYDFLSVNVGVDAFVFETSITVSITNADGFPATIASTCDSTTDFGSNVVASDAVTIDGTFAKTQTVCLKADALNYKTYSIYAPSFVLASDLTLTYTVPNGIGDTMAINFPAETKKIDASGSTAVSAAVSIALAGDSEDETLDLSTALGVYTVPVGKLTTTDVTFTVGDLDLYVFMDDLLSKLSAHIVEASVPDGVDENTKVIDDNYVFEPETDGTINLPQTLNKAVVDAAIAASADTFIITETCTTAIADFTCTLAQVQSVSSLAIGTVNCSGNTCSYTLGKDDTASLPTFVATVKDADNVVQKDAVVSVSAKLANNATPTTVLVSDDTTIEVLATTYTVAATVNLTEKKLTLALPTHRTLAAGETVTFSGVKFRSSGADVTDVTIPDVVITGATSAQVTFAYEEPSSDITVDAITATVTSTASRYDNTAYSVGDYTIAEFTISKKKSDESGDGGNGPLVAAIIVAAVLIAGVGVFLVTSGQGKKAADVVVLADVDESDEVVIESEETEEEETESEEVTEEEEESEEFASQESEKKE